MISGDFDSEQDELRGFSAVTDNVLRRQEYGRRHPSVTITHVENPRLWIATWTDQGNWCTLRDDSLGGLLDALDNLELGTA